MTLAALEVVDVLGACSLERRSSTLDGSVPLRVAQACVPFLEGNAWGWQAVWRAPLTFERKLGGWRMAGGDEFARRQRAAGPMLLSEGLLARESPWPSVLEAEPGRAKVAGCARGSIVLFTGLLVRPKPGVRLRWSGTRNRGSAAYFMRESLIVDTERFTPLMLALEPRQDEWLLQGEVATLSVLGPPANVKQLSLAEAPEVAHAHLNFYDAAYFEAKHRGEVTRKYRIQQGKSPAPESALEPRLDLVDAGLHQVDVADEVTLIGPSGVSMSHSDDRLVMRNTVPLDVQFDGLSVQVRPDVQALAAHARGVRQSWEPVLAAAGHSHPGALLYLSKYVTPHPLGEPHFFVKPAALFRTSPGVSLLVEGCPADGYDVLRGLIESDWFHAAPAVFQLPRTSKWLHIPAGAQLLELRPVVRSLLDASFEFRQAGLVSAWHPEVGNT